MTEPSGFNESAIVSRNAGTGRRSFRLAVALGILAALVGICFWVVRWFLPNEDLYQLGQIALTKKDFSTAEEYALRILAREPESTPALLLAARAVAETGRYEQALEYTARIPDDGSTDAVEARCVAGDVLLNKMKQPWDAYQEFQRAYQQDPNSINAHNFLSHILRLATRTWEMVPHEVWVAKHALSTPRRLYQLSLGHGLHTDRAVIAECRKKSPDDPIVQLGLADIAILNTQLDEAERRYRNVIASHPQIIEAHVRLGLVILRTKSKKKFYRWNAELPSAADRHPLTWSLRGQWAVEHHEPKVAIRCFGESVRLDPNHLRAVYRLGQLLVAEGKEEWGRPFLQRARLLERYKQATHALNVLTDKPTPDVHKPLRAAELATKLGLGAEAFDWIRLTLLIDPDLPIALQARRRLTEMFPKLPDTRAVPEANPALALDLSGYPLPHWPTEARRDARANATDIRAVRVSFKDMASSAGIDFRYFKGGDPDIRGLTRVYRFNGGGVAVLDFDGDGWPDIYLTQGAESPDDVEPSEHLDRLYRNTGDGGFENVTESAGLAENRYSQGVTVGDFNDDGFSDLYVANIGGNRLYRNNGDGTFVDVSGSIESAGKQWTTSCVMADLNGDALPDIYDVNYLEGDNVFTTVCRDKHGKQHACLPLQFESAADKLYVNRGDGTFENVSEQAGILLPNGKGLGIVAADFTGSGRLDLFIANDGVANFFFVNGTKTAADQPNFSERALMLGTACNKNGEQEACMGVAAGDSDADGLLDLFVTNFSGETNTLYRLQTNGLFVDATAQAGLSEPGRRMLGFGSQFLDGSLRGSLDLMATNGHIDLYETGHAAYEMAPQYFYNHGDGTFSELTADVLGPYFEGKYLGRSMARIDWNRDGKEDIIISHLDAPVALLTNTTEAAGHFLSLQLVGVESARDAIGATVTLTAGGHTQVHQLTAGDGYQASNERILVFGLGDALTVDSLQVHWPSGKQQKFTRLAGDCQYLCIEGTTALMKRAF